MSFTSRSQSVYLNGGEGSELIHPVVYLSPITQPTYEKDPDY